MANKFMNAKFYVNGNYKVCILSDGTKIRTTEADDFIPSFAENCDVKVTDKCSQGCPFCYEGCTPNGKHADLFKYKFIDTLHPYTEMALNGNDLDHPDFEDFLKKLKDRQVFANVTVNQNQFIANFETLKRWQSDGLIHGIGVSFISGTHDKDLITMLKSLDNIVIHTIVGILSSEDVEFLADNGLKVLMLGYKELQRGISYKENKEKTIESNRKWLYDNLDSLKMRFAVLSFDNLALEQLDVKRLLTPEEWDEFYMGNDGAYTFYIDMVKGEFAKNSLATIRYPIGDKTIDEMFGIICANNSNYLKAGVTND